jgi:polygalacturonase
MSIVKITDLPAATTPVSPSDVLPVVQNGVTKKTAINQLGFALPDTGAITRTIQSKLSDVVSVKDFGAAGDGVTDDTAAIQAAIDSLPNQTSNQGTVPEGGQIFFPAGVYKITSAINIGANDRSVELIGAGKGRSIINVAFQGVGINVSGTDTGAGYTKNFVLRDMRVQSTTVTNRPVGTKLLSIKYLNYFSIERCWFQGETYNAIYIEDALDGRIVDVRIDTAATNNQGFYNGMELVQVGVIGAPNQITIDQCYIEDTFLSAIRLLKGEKVVIRNTLMQSNERNGIFFDQCNSLHIHDNYFEANGQSNASGSCDIVDGTSPPFNLSRNIRIDNNHFSGDMSSATFNVLFANDVRGLTFSENDLRGGSQQFITVSADSKAVRISDNIATIDPNVSVAVGSDQIIWSNNRTGTGVYWSSYTDTEAQTYFNASNDITTYPATVTPDRRKANIIDYRVIAGDVTINVPTGISTGSVITIVWKQDGTGGRTVTFNADYKLATALSTTANERNVFTFYNDGVNMIELNAAVGST